MAILSKVATNVAPIFLEIIVKILQMEIASKIVPHVVTILSCDRLLKEINTIKIIVAIFSKKKDSLNKHVTRNENQRCDSSVLKITQTRRIWSESWN